MEAIWGIISLFIEFGLCGVAVALAWASLKIFPPKNKD